MRFMLPTPVPQPETAWRPPLYPVPWAPSPFDHFYFTRPISVAQKNWPSPDYRYGGVFFSSDSVHTGIDIPASLGSPVFASGSGQVVWTGWGLYTQDPKNKDDPYGLAVVIRHDFGFHDHPLFTVYAHLDKIIVDKGEWLQAGDKLGEVGQTGFTTGPHLHFEIRVGEDTFFNAANPELWLVPPQGWGILAARIADSYDNPLSNLEVTLISVDSGEKWNLSTYPAIGVHGDGYYQENLALSDLPAGSYKLSFTYLYKKREITIQIQAGNISYFYFHGLFGFQPLPPPTSESAFFVTPSP